MSVLRSYEKRYSKIVQRAMRQVRIIGGIRCGNLDWYNLLLDALNLFKIRNRIMDIARSYGNVKNNPVVGVQCLMGQIMLPYRFSGAIHMSGLWIGTAYTPFRPAAASLQMADALLAWLSPALAIQFFSRFLLISIQPFPIGGRTFSNLNDFFGGK